MTKKKKRKTKTRDGLSKMLSKDCTPKKDEGTKQQIGSILYSERGVKNERGKISF